MGRFTIFITGESQKGGFTPPLATGLPRRSTIRSPPPRASVASAAGDSRRVGRRRLASRRPPETRVASAAGDSRRVGRRRLASMSSLNCSSGASIRFLSRKLSASTSSVCPVSCAMRSQWRACIALCDIISSSGHVSLKSSIVLRSSSYACHSLSAFGSFRHLERTARSAG